MKIDYRNPVYPGWRLISTHYIGIRSAVARKDSALSCKGRLLMSLRLKCVRPWHGQMFILKNHHPRLSGRCASGVGPAPTLSPYATAWGLGDPNCPSAGNASPHATAWGVPTIDAWSPTKRFGSMTGGRLDLAE